MVLVLSVLLIFLGKPNASHWQTLSHNVVSSTPNLRGIQNRRIVQIDFKLNQCNYPPFLNCGNQNIHQNARTSAAYLWKESFNSDSQQSNQYQQNKKSCLTLTHWTPKKTMTSDVWIPGAGWGQANKYGGIKPVNGIPALSSC
jgi:hypothetical protein